MTSIECTLHGSLEDCLPATRADNRATLTFKHPPDVDELLARLELDRENLQFILADGQYIDLEDWGKPISSSHVQLWPRMSGG